jgi:hypothetical protein
MEREEIYRQLNEQIPFLKSHGCTERIMETTNQLLDELVEIQHVEAFTLLEDEFEVGYGL